MLQQNYKHALAVSSHDIHTLTMREHTIENHLRYLVEMTGGRSYKWTSTSLRGVPDQIVLMEIPPEHREIVAKYIRFVETKAPGKKPRPQQLLRHAELQNLGFAVDVVDSLEDASGTISEMLKGKQDA